ncbi:MAG: DUF4345 family protein [Pseudomonadota bacterium]
MTEILNILLALLSIGFGAFGWLAPRFTAGVLDLTPGETTMGLSEIRASVGAVFVIAGIGAVLIATPSAWAMLGMIYLGAAVGRLTSCLLDRPATSKAWVYFAVELSMAAALLALNL